MASECVEGWEVVPQNLVMLHLFQHPWPAPQSGATLK